MTDVPPDIAAAIQARLDEDGDGWTVGQWIVGLTIERINSDGILESEPWWIAAPGLREWQMDALLFSVTHARDLAPYDTND